MLTTRSRAQSSSGTHIHFPLESCSKMKLMTSQAWSINAVQALFRGSQNLKIKRRHTISIRGDRHVQLLLSRESILKLIKRSIVKFLPRTHLFHVTNCLIYNNYFVTTYKWIIINRHFIINVKRTKIILNITMKFHGLHTLHSMNMQSTAKLFEYLR